MNRAIWSLVVIGCLGLGSCAKKPPVPSAGVPVNVDTVTSQKVYYYDKYPGTTVGLMSVGLLAQVPGYITSINFKEGSYVRKGQVLYEIDKRLYQANYDMAEANVRVAQGNYVEAKQDADRYTYLNKQDAVARQLYDHAIITLENAENSVQAAQQALKTAKTNLEYSTILSPFDGTIGISQVRVGNYVSAGTTPLDTISTNNPMGVDFLIGEKQLAHYIDFEKGKGRVDSLFTFLMPDNSLYPYPGSIYAIDRAVDPQTGTIRVRLSFPNQQNTLRAGMSCVVRVHNQDTTPQMLIPGKAILEQMGEYFVFVVKDTVINKGDTTHKEKEDTVQGPKLHALQRKVQLGQTIGANVIVKAGISDGDAIVVDGIQALHDGAKVVVGSPKKKTATEGKDVNEPATTAQGNNKPGASKESGDKN